MTHIICYTSKARTDFEPLQLMRQACKWVGENGRVPRKATPPLPTTTHTAEPPPPPPPHTPSRTPPPPPPPHTQQNPPPHHHHHHHTHSRPPPHHHHHTHSRTPPTPHPTTTHTHRAELGLSYMCPVWGLTHITHSGEMIKR